MTDRHSGDSHLDLAIDRAVREMMSVEPRADLRQRVLAELAGEPVRPSLWPRLAFGSAALAALVILLFVFAKPPAGPAVEETAVVARPPAAAPGSTGGATQPPTGTAPKTAGRGPAQVDVPQARTVARRLVPAAGDRTVQAASIDTGELIAIEPLAPVEPLAPIEPIGFPLLEANIKPITIERIAITPLTPPR